MTEILTPEQIACIREQWVELAETCPWDELLASHEKLRQLAEANHKDAVTERQMGEVYIWDLEAQLAKAREPAIPQPKPVDMTL